MLIMNVNVPKLQNISLHLIWIVDCSGSMAHSGKIQALNNAIRAAIPHLERLSNLSNEFVIFMRAVKFSNGASWHMGRTTRVENYAWKDLEATVGGNSDMGQAFSFVAEQLEKMGRSKRAVPPVLILVSDGYPTDDFRAGLSEIYDHPLGAKALRLAIAIDEEADLDLLQEFIGYPGLRPFEARSPERLQDAVAASIDRILTWDGLYTQERPDSEEEKSLSDSGIW
jgi:uncharacterized protein YegL